MNNYTGAFNLGRMLYGAYLQERDAEVPKEYVDIVAAVDRKIGWNRKIKPVSLEFVSVYMPEKTRDVLLGLSGGLDSTFQMETLTEQGFDVHAVHIAGLNKSYGKAEEEQARKLAGQREFISIKFQAPKQAFPDNPFKNQLILSFMLDIGIKRGITQYAVGSDWGTPLSEAVAGFTITDSVEVNRAFWDGVVRHYPQAELLFISNSMKKYDRLIYLFTKHKESFENISSCVAPLRYRNHLHEVNTRKFGRVVFEGRCGSCYKCCMEYLLLLQAGLVDNNTEYETHCWNILATSKISHRPDLFDLKLSKAERVKNLLNYGS